MAESDISVDSTPINSNSSNSTSQNDLIGSIFNSQVQIQKSLKDNQDILIALIDRVQKLEEREKYRSQVALEEKQDHGYSIPETLRVDSQLEPKNDDSVEYETLEQQDATPTPFQPQNEPKYVTIEDVTQPTTNLGYAAENFQEEYFTTETSSPPEVVSVQNKEEVHDENNSQKGYKSKTVEIESNRSIYLSDDVPNIILEEATTTIVSNQQVPDEAEQVPANQQKPQQSQTNQSFSPPKQIPQHQEENEFVKHFKKITQNYLNEIKGVEIKPMGDKVAPPDVVPPDSKPDWVKMTEEGELRKANSHEEAGRRIKEMKERLGMM